MCASFAFLCMCVCVREYTCACLCVCEYACVQMRAPSPGNRSEKRGGCKKSAPAFCPGRLVDLDKSNATGNVKNSKAHQRTPNMSDNTIHFLETHRRTMHHTTAALTVYRHEHTFKHTHTHVLSASASYISCPASVGCSCQEPPIQEKE